MASFRGTNLIPPNSTIFMCYVVSPNKVVYKQYPNMREVPLSLAEKKFIVKAAEDLKRLDGRKIDDFRKFEVHFGKEWGSVFVTLGDTKVLASVSSEVQEPHATRPNEGLLYINVEISGMAAPHLEGSNRAELTVHLNRMLDRCLKESKAVDLESLCIVADEKVWALRVDVIVINHDGNILDCSSLAALASLAHFKRQDVTTDGQEIIIHDPSERDVIPITLHHYPSCVSFAYFPEGGKILSDPTAVEERVADATLVFGINAYKELCALHLGGSAVLAPKVIMRCATRAAVRGKELIDTLKSRLAEDLDDRNNQRPVGFANCCKTEKITSLSLDKVKIQLSKFRLSQPLEINIEERVMDVDKIEEDDIVNAELLDLGDNTAEIIPILSSDKDPKSVEEIQEPAYGDGGPSQWIVVDKGVIELDKVPDEIAVIPVQKKEVEVISFDNSDEDEVHVLNASELQAASRVITKAGKGRNEKSKKKRGKK